MSCDHELAKEKTRCSGKNASYITMTHEGNKTFVASDNMFANAILGGGLDPKSNDISASMLLKQLQLAQRLVQILVYDLN